MGIQWAAIHHRTRAVGNIERVIRREDDVHVVGVVTFGELLAEAAGVGGDGICGSFPRLNP